MEGKNGGPWPSVFRFYLALRRFSQARTVHFRYGVFPAMAAAAIRRRRSIANRTSK